jgi:hypothetical protein
MGSRQRKRLYTVARDLNREGLKLWLYKYRRDQMAI